MNIPRILGLAAVLASAPLQAQTCDPNIRASAPSSRFTVDAKKATVLDKRTGLMWKQCSEGMGGPSCATGSPWVGVWQSALARATASTHGGYQDWRLPSAKELESLVERKCYSPAINQAVFPYTFPELYWSSTPLASFAGSAWVVSFWSGMVSDSWRDYTQMVRLVRAGR